MTSTALHTILRPLVSYDDLSMPQANKQITPIEQFPSGQPPSKRRRRSAQNFRHHWDDQSDSIQPAINYDEDVTDAPVLVDSDEQAPENGEDQESRQLTHEEIWDDSALIEAWNAATADYEV
jgi:hypothetical protein